MSQFCPNLKCRHNNADHAKLCEKCATRLTGLLGQESLLIGSAENRQYVIQSLLGAGGMGAVYLAHERDNKQNFFAVKENLFLDTSLRNQFEREATVLMSLDHPNLPKVTDHFFEASGKQYLVMEYVAGDDLKEWLTKHKRADEDQVLEWADALLSTLTYLHTRSKIILHRDIKPSNLKVTPLGKLMLIDFGLVKQYSGDFTTTLLSSHRGFTLEYSPPEQVNSDERTDPSSDLYAVGATLYHLLSGKLPPPAGSRAAGTTELQPLRKLVPEISAKTEAFVQKAMSLHKADRFQSAEAMRQAVLNAQQKTGRFNIRPLKMPRGNRLETAFMGFGVVVIMIGLGLLANLMSSASASPTPTRAALPATQAGLIQATATAAFAEIAEATATETPAPTKTPVPAPSATPNIVLATITSPATTTRTPTVTSTATKATPTETTAPTPTANRTRTATPTRTRVPTATPDLDSDTPTPFPPTAVSVVNVVSPGLISPPAGASFSSAANPTFSWSSAGNLGTFDYYQFQIRHSQGWDVICTKNTSSLARSYVPSLNPSQWTVNVVRLSSAISNGSACSGNTIATSEVRSLSWASSSGGGSAPAANPTRASSSPANPPTAAPAPSQPTPTPCIPGPGNAC